MWVSQRHNPVAQTGGPARIFTYDMASKAHKPTEDFNDAGSGGERCARRHLVGRDHHVRD